MNNAKILNKQWIAHAALLTVGLIYGANYSVAKIAMEGAIVHPFAIVFMRIFTGAIVFLSLYFIFIREKIDKKDIPLLILCGLTGTFINITFFFWGLHHTNPINAALVMTITPILVIVFSYLILKDKITTSKGLGIFIALVGAIILIYKPEQAFDTNHIKGDLMILTNATSYSLYLVLVKKMLLKYNPITILMIAFSVGAICIIPIGLPHIITVSWFELDTSVYWAIGFIIILTTIVAYLLNAFALQKVKSTTVGAYIYLQPLLATFFALLLQKDQLNSKMILSAALIFIGLYLVSKKK